MVMVLYIILFEEYYERQLYFALPLSLEIKNQIYAKKSVPDITSKDGFINTYNMEG